MNKKLIESLLFMVVGLAMFLVVELKYLQFTELFMILMGFIGLAAVFNGIFGFYEAIHYKKYA